MHNADQPPDAAARTFEEDALRCLDAVARFALSLTRAPDDADDLVQETYLRAFKSRHTWKDGADMRRWLFTICKNAFLRTNERAQRQESLSDDPTDETLAVVRLHNGIVASGEASLFDRVSASDAIDVALGQLSEPARLVAVLVDLEGYSYDEAASVLDVPVGTVRSRLFRARRQLQELLLHHARDLGFSTVPISTSPRDHA